MKLIIFYFCFLITILINSCVSVQKKNIVSASSQSNKNQTDSIYNKEYKLSDFSKLNVQLDNKDLHFSIYLYQQSETWAEVLGDESNHQQILFKQDGENLTLSLNKNSSNAKGNVEIHLFTPNIKSVKLKSPGFIEIKDFYELNELETIISGCGTIRILSNKFSTSINNLSCEINGAGEIFTNGKFEVENGSFSISGYGEINVKSCDVKKASTNINGNGDIYLTPIENLNGIINGGGNIYYFGKLINPSIIINGCGEVIANKVY